MKLNQKLVATVSSFAIIVSGLTSLVFYKAAENQVMQDIRQRLNDIVSIAGATLDADLHARLTDPAQEGSTDYVRFRNRLQTIRDSSSDIFFVYTMRKGSNGQITFVVDAETKPEDVAHLGEVYDDASETLATSFANLDAPLVEQEFYNDEWGTWLSGYAPFFDADGVRVGVLGVDISAATVHDYKWRLLVLSLGAFGLVLPLTILLGLSIGRRISQPIIAMKEGAERMGQGDLDYRLHIDRKDEIGALASELNAMAAKLKHGRDNLSVMMEKYRNIFDNAIEGIFQSTLDGNLLNANKALAGMLGYETGDELAASITDLKTQVYASPEDRGLLLQSLRDKGRAEDMIVRMKRRDGSFIWVQLNAQIVQDQRSGPRLEGMVQDITERLDKEKAETERKAAEAASQAKSDFLANMSHEIRTPLNAVMGLTDLALKTELTERQSQYLKKIKMSSQSLLAVINDILDFSKIEAGRLELEHTDFLLYEIMANLSEMFAFQAYDRQIEFAVSIAPGVPTALVGDPVRLGQVLINLTGNAMKFTEKGEVVVSAELAESSPDADESRSTLRFTVRDPALASSPDGLPLYLTPSPRQMTLPPENTEEPAWGSLYANSSRS